MNIGLLGTAVLIKRDTAATKTAAGIFLGDSPDKLSTGIVVQIGEVLLETKALNSRVRFRESFAEPLMIDGGEYLYFRDLESAIYYYVYE